MMKCLVVDTEVASLKTKEPIEVAYAPWDIGELGVKPNRSRFEASGGFDPAAILIHGIFPEDLKGCPPSSEAPGCLPEAEYWIGHQVDFDWSVLGSPEVKRICTLAITKRLFPDLSSYRLGPLYFERHGVTKEVKKRIDDMSHRAAGDVEMVVDVLDWIVQISRVKTIEKLWEMSESARIPELMPFGKHSGEKISELPKKYLEWCVGNLTDVDPYLMRAIEKAHNPSGLFSKVSE